MATNPSATFGGWGLSPVGSSAPSTMPPALQAPSQFTPAQIAQMRQEAMALQQPPQQGIHHWTQGLAELVRAIQGNREADFARQQEMAGRQQGAQAIGQIYAPYLSQGGVSPSAAGGAPAETLGSGPAGAQTGDAAPPTPAPSSSIGGDAVASADSASSPVNAVADASDPRGMVPYIRETAAKYGVDPDVAVKVAGSEGLKTFSGDGGKSGGAFQLYTGGGMGNDFQKETGLDPLDPKNEKATIDYALKNVPKTGWTPFHGARRAGIGERDGILADNSPATNGPTGLLAPIPTVPPVPMPVARPAGAPAIPMPVASPDGTPAVPMPVATPPVRLAYGGTGNIPPGMVPSPAIKANSGAGNLAPMIDAIAGQPAPTAAPGDFMQQVAAMEKAKAARAQAELAGSPTAGPVPPGNDLASQAAAMEAAKAARAQAEFGGQPSPATAPIVAPTAAPPLPPPITFNGTADSTTMPLPSGSAIPGAVGPTSVNGGPLVPPGTAPLPPAMGATSVNGAPLPQSGSQVASLSPMISAIAGRPVPPPISAPSAGGGAPNPYAPIQVAQNGQPTSAAPSPAGGPPGLPQPLTSPIGQVTPQQLTAVMANPWIPPETKNAMLTMIQQRGQVQTMPVEGGTLQFDASGRRVFIPEPKFGTVKVGGAEIPTVSHFDPATRQWNTTTLAPGGGVQTAGGAATGMSPTTPKPGEPDLSTIGGIQANEAAQKGAVKGAEEGATTSAKYYDAVHRGLAGSGMIAAQQKQNIDALRQIASSPDFISGTFGDSGLAIQRMAAGLGINPTGAAPRELFNQLAAKVLADQFSGLKSMASETGEAGGRVFKPMLDIEEKANITADDTPAGIGAKLNLLDNAGNLMMKYADMADDYIKDHGKLDAGFDKQIRNEISKSRLSNVVPQANAGASTTKTIGDKTYYQIGGKWFDNPEGK
jgi:hypothetical protein